MGPTLRYELIYYFKNKSELIVISVLFVSFFVLFPFTLRDRLNLAPIVANSLLWLAALTVYSLSANSLYERDRVSGRLEYYQLQALGLQGIIWAKWLANYLAVLLPMVVILPILLLFAGIGLESLPKMLLGLAIGSVALSAITNLTAVLMAGFGQGAGAMMGLLILPLAIPVIIFGADYTTRGETSSLGVITGVALFILPMLGLAGGSSIRSSN